MNDNYKTFIIFNYHYLQDVENLIQYFGQNVIDVIKLDGWNHLDFLYGKEANKMVYQRMIEVMGKY